MADGTRAPAGVGPAAVVDAVAAYLVAEGTVTEQSFERTRLEADGLGLAVRDARDRLGSESESHPVSFPDLMSDELSVGPCGEGTVNGIRRVGEDSVTMAATSSAVCGRRTSMPVIVAPIWR